MRWFTCSYSDEKLWVCNRAYYRKVAFDPDATLNLPLEALDPYSHVLLMDTEPGAQTSLSRELLANRV